MSQRGSQMSERARMGVGFRGQGPALAKSKGHGAKCRARDGGASSQERTFQNTNQIISHSCSRVPHGPPMPTGKCPHSLRFCGKGLWFWPFTKLSLPHLPHLPRALIPTEGGVHKPERKVGGMFWEGQGPSWRLKVLQQKLC